MKKLLIKNVKIFNKNKLSNVDILIEGSKIIYVGNKITKPLISDTEIFDCKNKFIVFPGLINAHIHSRLSIFKGKADEKNFKEVIEIIDKNKFNFELQYIACLITAIESIRNGVTSLYSFLSDFEPCYKAFNEVGINSTYCLIAKKKYDLKKIHALFKKFSPKAEIHFGVPNLDTVPISLIKKVHELSKKIKTCFSMHISETEESINNSMRFNKCMPVELLNRLKIFSNKTNLIHAVHLNEKEIKILKNTHTNIVHCPISNSKLATGIMNLRTILENKINIGLGTDGSIHNNANSILSESKYCCLLHKVLNKDPKIITAKDLFNIITKNNAKIINRNAGEIKIGKKADIIFFPLDNIGFIPNFDPISNLIYNFENIKPEHVIIDGKFILKNGILLRVNEKNILKRAQELVEKYL